MATGTFTYNALRTKNTEKNCKSFKFDKSNAVSVGTTAIKLYLSICQVGLVWFARYCGKMYSRHLFSHGGLEIMYDLNHRKDHCQNIFEVIFYCMHRKLNLDFKVNLFKISIK